MSDPERPARPPASNRPGIRFGLPRSLWLWLAAGWTLAVVALALDPQPAPITQQLNDRIAHAAAFAVLAWLWSHAGRWQLRGWPLALSLTALGGLIEAVQTQIPTRQGEWSDLLADVVGVAVGMAVAAAMRR